MAVSSTLAENCNCFFEATLKKLNATDIQLFIGPRGAKPQLSVATQAAIKAYEHSGKMLDAALTYAAHGFPVFPITINKTPVPARDKDADGKPIPGTGSFYKATCDPIQIRKWWAGHEYLIGLPMGKASGVWCLDVDTAEDHDDGVAGWNEIAAGHELIVTREHRSATGGPHLIFNWSADQPIGCSSGDLPGGIEVKGQGGYIVVPPSRRKGRSYTVHSDIDPADAPAWLLDKIWQGRSARCYDNSSDPVAADFDELAEALSFIPNDDLGWDDWTAMGLRIFAATRGEGFELFDAFSQRSEAKYDAEATLDRWEAIQGSPPDRTGAEVIFKMAREHGWVQGLRQVPPTYDIEFHAADDARRLMRELARKFLLGVANPDPNPFTQYYVLLVARGDISAVRAVAIDVGVGKTQITIEELAAWLLTVTIKGPIMYAVPRHKLGVKIVEQFTAHGINARIFRGREAMDPEGSDEMCLNLPAVELAKRAHADIAKSCCRDGKKFCRFFDSCGYQRQQVDGEAVQVWIVAADMLFHSQKVFGKPAAVIIDEGFWRKGVRGVEHEACTVPLDSLKCNDADRNAFRNMLQQALSAQDNGPVDRRQLDAMLLEEDCTQANKLEWKAITDAKIKIEPGMSEAVIKALYSAETIDAVAHGRKVIRIFAAARELLQTTEIEKSGRLQLKQKNGQRVIEWRGVAPIKKQFAVPTLLLDATLPDPSVLQVYHPEVEVVGDIKVAFPSAVQVRQVLRSPTSSRKLENNKHLDEVRRYVLQRWMEIGRQSTVVICQKKVDEWLACSELPHGIAVEHYNDIAGLDDYRDVRLLIAVGRTAPGPGRIENMAAALSGAQPFSCAYADGRFAWYPQVGRGIRLADGRGIETKGDRHPDDFVEAVRWQVHEAELVQAIGRARAINRTASTPLDVDLLFDSCLPLTVNEVVTWSPPSLLIETAAEGVMLTSPVDMVKLWPKLWSNPRAAYRSVQAGVPVLPGFETVTYRLKGANMKRRVAHFDRSLISDPEAWLRERLGPLDLL